MLRIAGENPLLRDAAHAGFCAAHLAAQRCRGTHLLKFRSGLASGRARSHAVLRARKIMMMIVMMEVMCFLSRSRWQAFGLWTRFKRRFGLRVGVEERIGSQRYCTRTPFRWCRCRSFRPCACTNCVSAHAAEFVVAAIVISANAACGCGRTIRWILGVVVDHILSCIFCVYLGSKPLHRLKRGGQSLGTGLGTPQFRLQPAIQRLQFRSADGLGLTGFSRKAFCVCPRKQLSSHGADSRGG